MSPIMPSILASDHNVSRQAMGFASAQPILRNKSSVPLAEAGLLQCGTSVHHGNPEPDAPCSAQASTRRPGHDPEKHALGLDPGVETGFRKRSCPNKR